MNVYTNIFRAKQNLELLNKRSTWEFMDRAVKMCVRAINTGHKVMICGNGGSNCDAEHFAEELTGFLYDRKRRGLDALHLGGAGHITCVSNDVGFEDVFSRLVDAHGRRDDVLIGLSTSGASENVGKALRTAQDKDIHTIVLVGPTPATKLGYLTCSLQLPCPGQDSARIQEIHKLLLHSLAEGIEELCSVAS